MARSPVPPRLCLAAARVRRPMRTWRGGGPSRLACFAGPGCSVVPRLHSRPCAAGVCGRNRKRTGAKHRQHQEGDQWPGNYVAHVKAWDRQARPGDYISATTWTYWPTTHLSAPKCAGSLGRQGQAVFQPLPECSSTCKKRAEDPRRRTWPSREAKLLGDGCTLDRNA